MARLIESKAGFSGIIMTVVGELNMLGKDGDILPLVPGDRIYPGDMVRTGPESLARIKLMDGEIVELQSNSLFSAALPDEKKPEFDDAVTEPAPVWQPATPTPSKPVVKQVAKEQVAENPFREWWEEEDGLHLDAVRLGMDQFSEQTAPSVPNPRLADYSGLGRTGISSGDIPDNLLTSALYFDLYKEEPVPPVVIPPPPDPGVSPLVYLDVTNGVNRDYAVAFTEGDADESITAASNWILELDDHPTDGVDELMSSALVTIRTPLTGDQLAVNTGGLPSGITAVLNGDSTQVTLSGSASASDYEEALKQIRFSNSNENPVPGVDTSRDIEIAVVVSDSRSQTSEEAVTTVTLTEDNDFSVVDLSLALPGDGFSVNFIEADDATGTPADIDSAAVALVDNDIQITDVDDTLLTSAVIQIVNARAEDQLQSIGTLPAGIVASTYFYDAVTGVGTFVLSAAAGASLDDFETALQTLHYTNTSDAPDTTARTISIVVSDETASAATFTPFSPPDLTLTPLINQSVVVVPNGTAVTDLTDGLQFSATVEILNGMTDDVLEFPAGTTLPNDITATYDADTYVMTLTSLSGSTPEQFQTALESVLYASNADAGSFDNTDRDIRITLIDKSFSTPVTTTVTVIPVNDLPESADKTQAMFEDQALIFTPSDTVILGGFTFGTGQDTLLVTELPTSGRLYIEYGTHQENIIAGQAISKTLIDNNQFRYEPAGHTAYTADFKFRLLDDQLYLPDITTLPSNSETITYTTTELDFVDINGVTQAFMRIASLPANGRLFLYDTVNDTETDVTLGMLIHRDDVDDTNDLRLRYTADDSGTVYPGFTYQLMDNSESINTITVSAPDFLFTDVDGDRIDHILIEALPDEGLLYMDYGTSQVSVIPGQQISRTEIEQGLLRFAPDAHEANVAGNPYASFTFKVHDGTGYSEQTHTYTINVTALVDDPENNAVSLTAIVENSDFIDGTGADSLDNWTGNDASVSAGVVTINPGGFIAKNVPVAPTAQKYILNFDYTPTAGETLTIGWFGDPNLSITLTVGGSDGNGGTITAGVSNAIRVVMPYVEGSFGVSQLLFSVNNTGAGAVTDAYQLDNVRMVATANDIYTGADIPVVIPSLLTAGRTTFFDDLDGSEEQAVIIYGLTNGATVWDGKGNSATFTGSDTYPGSSDYLELVNGTGPDDQPWDISSLRVTPPAASTDNMVLTIVAGANEGATDRTTDLLNPLLGIAQDSNAEGQVGEYTVNPAPNGQLAAYAENILITVSPVNTVTGTNGDEIIDDDTTNDGANPNPVNTTSGDDLINTGGGLDRVTGGGGSDTYIFNSGNLSRTTITDFVIGGNRLANPGTATLPASQALGWTFDGATDLDASGGFVINIDGTDHTITQADLGGAATYNDATTFAANLNSALTTAGLGATAIVSGDTATVTVVSNNVTASAKITISPVAALVPASQDFNFIFDGVNVLDTSGTTDFVITIDGTDQNIALAADSYTDASTFVTDLNTALTGLGATASVVGSTTVRVSSGNKGAGGSLEIAASGAAATALANIEHVGNDVIIRDVTAYIDSNFLDGFRDTIAVKVGATTTQLDIGSTAPADAAELRTAIDTAASTAGLGLTVNEVGGEITISHASDKVELSVATSQALGEIDVAGVNNVDLPSNLVANPASTSPGGASETLWFQAMDADAVNNLTEYFDIEIIDTNGNGAIDAGDNQSVIKFNNNGGNDFGHEVVLENINLLNFGSTNVEILNNLIANGNIVIGDVP